MANKIKASYPLVVYNGYSPDVTGTAFGNESKLSLRSLRLVIKIKKGAVVVTLSEKSLFSFLKYCLILT